MFDLEERVYRIVDAVGNPIDETKSIEDAEKIVPNQGSIFPFRRIKNLKELEMKCPNCDKKIIYLDDYCPHCGYELK